MEPTGEPSRLEEKGTGSNLTNSRCVRCGAAFECGANGPAPCWCAAYPRVMPVPQGNAGCYCPSCLAELTAQR